MNEAQRHAFGVIGGAAFGLDRKEMVKLAKELAALGLVATDGAHSGHNRSTYHWRLTDRGAALFVEMVKGGVYPLASRTVAGREALGL